MRALGEARARTPAVCVAFSGGYDSVTVLDLCVRTFDRVEPFFMYIVPDLDCMKLPLEWAERTYGLKVRYVPHWLLSRFLTDGVYCDPCHKRDDFERWDASHVFAAMMAETKIPMVATGEKASDNQMRRRFGESAEILRPIKVWTQLEVKRYVADRNLMALPRLPGMRAGGVDLSTRCLLWLAQYWPTDFVKICEVFPYAEAAVWRYRWHGITT